MSKIFEQAIDAASALPDKDQTLVAVVIFSIVESSKGPSKVNLDELAWRVSREAKRRGMTREISDQILADV